MAAVTTAAKKMPIKYLNLTLVGSIQIEGLRPTHTLQAMISEVRPSVKDILNFDLVEMADLLPPVNLTRRISCLPSLCAEQIEAA